MRFSKKRVKATHLQTLFGASRLVVASLLVAVTGCVEVEERTPPGTSPLGATDAGTAYNAARIVAIRDGDTIQGTLRGDSMEPMLSDGTVIVIKPVEFDEIDLGMDVAYRNARGDMVLHRIVRRRSGGWVAKGLNNPKVDPDLVTPDNLIGVLYAVFYNQGNAAPTGEPTGSPGDSP